MLSRFFLLLFLAFSQSLLVGCDALQELLELPNPAKAEAEGRAIGSACRYSGRSLEDCYALNPTARKAAVFAGWKEMNDYMMEHKMEAVPSQIPLKLPAEKVEEKKVESTPVAPAASAEAH